MILGVFISLIYDVVDELTYQGWFRYEEEKIIEIT